MTYKNIRQILKNQIKNNIKSLWTFDEESMSFTMIYSSYKDDLQIYTPQQLLNRLDEIEG
jgi:hypothetical protein|tara:strand:+ start:901 stop:1080 length:180 start_codon:yes stop_codon:yes gene_type:complete